MEELHPTLVAVVEFLLIVGTFRAVSLAAAAAFSVSFADLGSRASSTSKPVLPCDSPLSPPALSAHAGRGRQLTSCFLCVESRAVSVFLLITLGPVLPDVLDTCARACAFTQAVFATHSASWIKSFATCGRGRKVGKDKPGIRHGTEG